MRQIKQRRWKTDLIIYASTSLLLGVICIKWSTAIAVTPLFVFWALIYQKKALLFLVCFGVFFSIGTWRGYQVKTNLDRVSSYINTKVELEGVVNDDPAYSENGQIEAYVSKVQLTNGTAVPGKIRVRGYGFMSRGDTVKVAGKLREGYGPYQAAIYYAEIAIVKKDAGLIAFIRSRFQASLLSIFPEPHGSFGFGLLVGARSGLPPDFAKNLSVVGLTHLIAVSGYNLTIIINACRRVLSGFSPRVGLATSITVIVGFLMITGFSASIVRASMVAGIGLLAWYFGRQVRPILLIVLPAAITSAMNPLFPWSDVGWYLSFGAFSGILLGAPRLVERLGLSSSTFGRLFVESTMAYLATLPIIMLLFGRVSIIAPLVNFLVLPFVPLIMLMVFIAGIIGMISTIIGLWVSIIPSFLISGIIGFVGWSGSLKFSQSEMRISFAQTLALYGLLIFMIVVFRQNRRKMLK